MSYCRITGKAKGLPKPNYFPLLSPISPADARRFCRITGKAYGLPSHRYIPVVLTTYLNPLKCKITNSTDFGPHHYEPDYNYGKRKHLILTGYRYMIPVFDETNDQQRNLLDLLKSKIIQHDDHQFVYTVDEKKCSLVFPARLEAAVRDGDVRDVMFAKTNDSVLLRMSKGKNVSLDLHEFDTHSDGVEKHLFNGEGPRQDVLLARELEESERERKQTKRRQNLMHMAKIFESKDQLADDDDEEYRKNMAIKEAKRKRVEAKRADKVRRIQYNEFNGCATNDCNKLHMDANDSTDLVKPIIESWDWDTYAKEASKSNCRPILSKMPKPHNVKAEIIQTHDVKIDIEMLQSTIGFDAIPCIVPLQPCSERPSAELIDSIKLLDNVQRERLENLINTIVDHAELVEAIPNQSELIKVLQNYSNGVFINDASAPLCGLSINIGSDENPRYVFVPGCMTSTTNGDVFVAGQTISSGNADSTFLPGLTVNSSTGVAFVPGFVMTNENNSNSVFLAGQISNDEFICGQTVYTDMPRFVEGQTVVTNDGLKFVAGKLNEATGNFVCGQTLSMPDGSIKFIPGQMSTKSDGTEQFIAGQSVFSEDDGWIFVPGQTVDERFIAGKSIITAEGAKFIPGQYLNEVFVPGISVETDAGIKFVAGLNVETKHGEKFVEGQIVYSEHGEIFLPGKTTVQKSGDISFRAAKTVDDIVYSEAISSGLVIDSNSINVSNASLSVYGHMVQTQNGIEFYPNKIDLASLPNGKIVPGKLIRQNFDTKFVPGIMENDGFIPGQVVWTENGE